MFSASLLSMMVHSLPPTARQVFLGPSDEFSPEERPGGIVPAGPGQVIPDPPDLASRFERALNAQQREWPLIPVIARASPDDFRSVHNVIQGDGDFRRGFLWGRAPLDELMRHYIAARTLEHGRENLDLGTPVREVSGASGLTGPTCATRLALTPAPGSATVGAAVVDSGVSTKTVASPKDFGGKLRYAVTLVNVDLSPHAEAVLEVLLDRLSKTTAPRSTTLADMLSITTVSMALMVSPTPDQIHRSLDCFHQHCAPELLTAVKAIDAHLDSDELPAVVNMSLGTHVGPHDGHSPLEAYISETLYRPSNRFLFAAAGNDGGKGISARLDLKTGEADFMELVVDEQCTELLVEFWWDDARPADVEIYATISGRGFSPIPIVIRPKLAGAALATPSMGSGTGVNFYTLLQSGAHGTMSCIAFAATRPAPAQELRVAFDLLAKSADVTVDAWVVICEKEMDTAFTQGGPEGTVSVPASDPKVVSVAGFELASQQMWRHSSRGPASRYSRTARTESPAMAHLTHGISGASSHGTSNASPRAAADAAKPLADPTRSPKCVEVEDLIQETYGLTSLPPWDSRYGFHKEIK